MTTLEITKMFSFHSVSDEQKKVMEELTKKFIELAQLVNDSCPDSREKSLAMTKLQEAKMFASSSIAQASGEQNT